AYQADLTRVSTFLIGREKSVRTYPEIGVADPHHPVSHHQGQQDLLEKLAKINAYHIQMFAQFLEKMSATPDGDGSLLDNSLIVYGADMSNSNAHVPYNLPVLVAGGKNSQVKGGRYIRAAENTPLANLHITLLGRMGVQAEHLGNSTGDLP